jgi:hypothetical protein
MNYVGRKAEESFHGNSDVYHKNEKLIKEHTIR